MSARYLAEVLQLFGAGVTLKVYTAISHIRLRCNASCSPHSPHKPSTELRRHQQIGTRLLPARGLDSKAQSPLIGRPAMNQVRMVDHGRALNPRKVARSLFLCDRLPKECREQRQQCAISSVRCAIHSICLTSALHSSPSLKKTSTVRNLCMGRFIERLACGCI